MAGAKQPLPDNPGVQLGLLLGTAANAGRDKITIFTSPEIYDLGAWLEQLIAESTGKQGKGITPVDREAIGAPEVYGKDRVFAYVRLKGTADASQDAKVAALEAAGHPVVSHRDCRSLRNLRSVLHVGNRDGRRRLGDGHQSVQPARRGIGEDRDAAH